MTLLELLVQELPKRGGWPEGYDVVSTNGYGAVWAYKTKGCIAGRELHFHSATEGHVTREQYEAATQQPVWNGEGLPPVGVEVEYQDSNNSKWYPVTIKYVSDQLVVICGVTNILGEEQNTEIVKDIVCDKPQFRPIRTEAERAIDEMVRLSGVSIGAAKILYDAGYRK